MEAVTPRDDSRPLAEWVADIPRVLAWIDDQSACPGCGDTLDAESLCYPSVASVWCGVNRRHQVPPEIMAVAT